MVEQLGLLTAGAATFILAGLLALAYAGWKGKGFHFLAHTSRKYLFVCGFLFMVNTVSFLLAIGLSTNRTQTVIAGLINNVWPVLSLWLSLFILKKKAKNYLFVGILLAFSGMWLASSNGAIWNYKEMLQTTNLGIYGLALTAAISWALYSNWSHKWAGDQDNAVPLFLLCSGLLLGFLRLFIPETAAPTSATFLGLAYLVVFPTILAYIFWDSAVRKGNLVIVVTLSYFIPLLSTLVSALLLGVLLRPDLWLAAGLVMSGAYICNVAIVD